MEKTTLPIKTKIAAWWMIVFGGVSVGVFLLALASFIYGLIKASFYWALEPIAFVVVYFLILMPSGLGSTWFLPGLFLLQRKKWGWRFALSILSIEMVILFLLSVFFFSQTLLLEAMPGLGFYLAILFGLLFLLILVPLILLLLDRNYHSK